MSRKVWTKMLAAHLPAGTRATKFNARVCVASDGKILRSKLELTRYEGLLILQRSGLIQELRTNTRWRLKIADVELGFYEGDFDYVEAGELVVEDCKGYVRDKKGRRPVTYRLFLMKKALMLALYGITVREIHRQ